MGRPRSFGLLIRNVSEIGKEPVLRAYGWAMLASHGVVFLFLLATGKLALLTTDVEPLCWPYFPSCWKHRLVSDDQANLLLVAYLGLILIGTVTLLRADLRSFWVTLVATNVLLFGIMSLDYRFRDNELYMLFWVNFVFLFWPAKRWSIALLIVCFYFWAGALKLNYEWLSGADLYSDLYWIPSNLAWAACAYVVAMEMVLIWGLLARRFWVLAITLAQLAIFHIESLSQIHWFYPLLMAVILSWFVIDRVVGSSGDRPRLQMSMPRPARALILLFAALQLAPFLFGGQRALTGQGRLFALHMFEARQVCEVTAVMHYATGNSMSADLKLNSLPPRMICDPIVYYDRVRNLCRLRADYRINDVDLVMKIRRTTDSAFYTVIDEEGFCRRNLTYSMVRNNSWLK